MRRLLAVDTATWWGSAALVEGDEGTGRCEVVAELRRRTDESHAARLLPMVDELLAAAGRTRASIDAFAAARGPGSFTGLRVGLGILRGLEIASGRPCVAVGTLDAMAEAYGSAPGPRLPLMDASRGQVYGALFDPAGSPPPVRVAPWLSTPEGAAARAPAGAIAFGPGAALHEAELRALGVAVDLQGELEGIAGAVGRVAWLRLDAGTALEDPASPLYLRPADAELAR